METMGRDSGEPRLSPTSDRASAGRGGGAAAYRSSDKPVFVTENGRRRRALRLVAFGLAAITGTWAIALLAGALGSGRLPVLPLPPIGALRDGSGAQTKTSLSKRDAAGSRAQTRGASRGPAGRATERAGSPDREVPSRGSDEKPKRPGTGREPSPPPPSGAGTTPSTSTPTAAPTSTAPGRVPSQTPSGNPVPAGTTDLGAARGWAPDPPGAGTHAASGR
jgi:hypothetical protein